MEPPAGTLSRRAVIWLCAALLLAAALLRVAGMFNDFWIDEIISWDIARTMLSPIQILTSVHHDNNHHLNTLWMYLLGERRFWVWYRVPSVVAGVVTVALMAKLASRGSRRAAVIAAALGATSYFLIQYSSEARGYALATMFSLACALLLENYLETRRRTISFAFGLCAILGMLSHLSFLYVYLGLVVWSVLARCTWRDSVRLHGLAIVFVITLYVIDTRLLTVGAGPIYSRWHVIVETAGWTIGMPRVGIWPVVAAALVLLGLIGGVILIARANRPEASFYLIAICLGPALMLTLWRQPYVYPRYFVLCVPFFLVLVARLLAKLPVSVAAIILMLFVIGNAFNLANFYRVGRGSYLEALRSVQNDNSVVTTMTIGSTQDRRNRLMVTFYRRYLPAQPSIEYVDDALTAPEPPRWLIVDDVEDRESNNEPRRTIDGQQYYLARTFGYAGLSGMNWYVMKRRD